MSTGDQATYTLKLTEAEADELRGLLPAGRLRRKRRGLVRENSDYAQSVVRMIRTLARRAANDVDLLPSLRDIRTLVDELMHDAVDGCKADGYSWAEIAERLGTTRQAVQQRYGAAEDYASIHRQARIDVHRAG